MTARENSGAALEPLLEGVQRRIKGLQTEIGNAPAGAERKVRQLERVQLYHAVVTRLSARDALMPEVARAHLRSDTVT
jgi:hypothetical protein